MIEYHDAEVRVRYAETDQMGVVYHANYLVWFEVGRVELMRALGFEYKRTFSDVRRSPSHPYAHLGVAESHRQIFLRGDPGCGRKSPSQRGNHARDLRKQRPAENLAQEV